MLQAAIIGAGNISHAHILAYIQFPARVRIAALVDILPGNAEKVKAQYGLECDCYLDHHETVSQTELGCGGITLGSFDTK